MNSRTLHNFKSLQGDVLIVDDEVDICEAISGIFEDEGCSVRTCMNSQAAKQEIACIRPILVILDVWLRDSDLDGLKLLEHIKLLYPDLPVIMISGHGTIDMALNAVRIGAYSFLEKPFKSEELLMSAFQAMNDQQLRSENRSLRKALNTTRASHSHDMIAQSTVMREAVQAAGHAAQNKSRVVLMGPRGTGKGTLARFIHDNSARSNGPFVSFNCASVPEEDQATQLFGRQLDDQMRIIASILETAHNGTLFLQNVHELSIDIQKKLVSAIHSGSFMRSGTSAKIHVDLRIISSSTCTEPQLKSMIDSGEFVGDLFYRLHVWQIIVPVLAARDEDIVALGKRFLQKLAQENGIKPPTLSNESMKIMTNYQWPGNLLELRHVLERCLLDSANNGQSDDDTIIEGDQIMGAISGNSTKQAALLIDMVNFPAVSLRDAREIFEREYLEFHLARFKGNVSRAASFVGMDRAALHRKIRALETTTREIETKQ